MAFVSDIITCLKLIQDIVNFANDLKDNYGGKIKNIYT